jgi:hypothetical protein
MTVGSGGLNADRAKYYALLHALSLSRLRDSSLPEGAFDGEGRRFARGRMFVRFFIFTLWGNALRAGCFCRKGQNFCQNIDETDRKILQF